MAKAGQSVGDDLFSYAAAQEAKHDGMERADANADSAWKTVMAELVVRVARQRRMFTADDVFSLFHEEGYTVATHDRRAFGPVMTRAAKSGVCKKFDGPQAICRRRSRHAAPIQVWESLIFEA
jgi:hypothetical protein